MQNYPRGLVSTPNGHVLAAVYLCEEAKENHEKPLVCQKRTVEAFTCRFNLALQLTSPAMPRARLWQILIL